MNPLRFLILSLCFMLTGFSNLIATELQTGREIADSTNIEPSLVKQLLWEARDIKSSADNNQIDDREGPQRDPAIILIAPNEIQLDLEPGVSEEREITVANNGDEPLEFTTFIDVVSAPDQSDIVNMRVLVLTDNEGLGGGQVMVEGAIEAGVLEENLNVIGSTDFPNIDLYDYDVLAFTDQQRWQYFQTYMWYRELIDEWIQAGGVLLMSGPTTLAIVPFTFPADVFYMDTGFLRSTHNIYEYQGECNPLIHGLIEDENDDLPEEIVVGACNYGAFLRPILQQINGISNVKTFYRQAFNDMAGDDAVTLITYDFGEGHILGSSLYASAFLYQPEDLLNGEWMDGAVAMYPRNMFLWADWIRRSSFVNIDPEFGIVDNGNPLPMNLTFDTELVIGGDYEIEVHFNSNDEENPDIVLNIELTVSDNPDIRVDWERSHGFPEVLDWNLNYPDLYVNEEYEMTFSITNYGTRDLVIQEVRFEGEGADFFRVVNQGDIPDVGRLERAPVTCIVTSDETGDFAVTAVIVSDDPDMGEFEIPLHTEIIGVPSIEVDPLDINADLEGAEIAEEFFSIVNTGNGILKFNIIEEVINQPERDMSHRLVRQVDPDPSNNDIPMRDMPGDILGEFAVDRGIGGQQGGLFASRSITLFHNPDDGLIYGQNSLSGVIMGYDPAEEYQPTRFFSLSSRYIHDMAYHDGVIYGASPGMRETFLYRYDMIGNDLGNLDLDWGGQPVITTGVAYVPERDVLLVTKQERDSNENELHLFSMEGEHLADLGELPPLMRWQQPGALEWVPEHPHGQLWLHSEFRIWQMEIDTENWEIVRVVQDFETFGLDPKDGITHDGENLFVTSRNHQICRILDDGINEDDWLTINPIRGEVDPGDEAEIVLTLNGTNLAPGVYQAELHIQNNDPENPLIDVVVTVGIEQFSDIQVSWPLEAGFNPDELEEDRFIDWNSFLEDVLVDQVYEIPLTVRNIGYGALEVSDISFDSEFFRAEPTEFQLDFWEERQVTLVFQPEEDGNYDVPVTFNSNDPNLPEFSVQMEAFVSEAPVIVVEPPELWSELNSGEAAEEIINITNEGESELRWSAEINYVDGDEDRDSNPIRSMRSIIEDHGAHSPLRDVPESKFLLFLEEQWHPFAFENVFQRVRDLDYNFINSIEQLSEIDFYDYDVLWFRTGFASLELREWWNENLEGIEEYVAAGYTVYLEQGGTEEFPFEPFLAPGGLAGEPDQQLIWIAEGAVSNYIVQNMEWEEHQYIFNYGLHLVYPRESLEQIENSELYEIILEGARDNKPGLVRYEYGFGNVVVSGMQEERGWREREDGRWGSCADVFIDYLDLLSNPDPWVSCHPKHGRVDPWEDNDIVVDFDSNGLIEGDYLAEIIISSNDPETPLVTVDITLTVNGIPEPEVVWDEIVGYPNLIDFNSMYEEMFARGSYPVAVTIRNIGFADLHIEEITSNRDGLISDWNPETESVVPAQDEIVVDFMIFAEGQEEINGAFRIIFDDEELANIVIPATGEFILGPILVVDPVEINEDLNTGERNSIDLILSNPGAAVLTWWTDAEIIEAPGENRDIVNGRNIRQIDDQFGPARDEPGDLINQVQWPNFSRFSIRAGLAWDPDNEWMWFTQDRLPRAYAVDPNQNYECVDEIVMPGRLLDICWYNGLIYAIVDGGRAIARIDMNGNRLEDIQTGDWIPDGIGVSYDLNLMFLIEAFPDRADRQIRVFEIAEDGGLGEQVGIIDNYREILLQDNNQLNNEPRSFLWVDAHTGGNMWLTTRSARGKVAWQFNLNFETWEVELIQNFVAIPQVPGTGYDALGHDGEDLWVEAFGIEVVYIVEDGLNERGWISWRPEEGMIDPDEESIVVLNLDARGVMPGEYAAELYFYSNDAIEFEDPDVIVDISLTISGNANIHVTPGGEDEDPLDFEIAYFDYLISRSVIVTNTGVDALALQTITRDEDNPDFYVEQDDLEGFILDQNEERELTIWYNANPERGGVQEATLLFETNADGWRDGYPVRCVASIGAFESPVLELNPQVINVDLREEQEQEFVISARNTGGSPLVFEAEVVIVEQPGDDNAQLQRQVRTVNQNPGPAPFRDDPRGRGILIQESCGWFEYDFEQHFENIENLEYDRFRTWDEIDQVDLSDYDFMWIGNCETEAWVAEHNQNLERIESFVNRGGVIYHSSSHFREAPDPRPINPGGLIYTGNNQIRDRIATIQLDPEENFLINYMNENDPEGWEWGSGQEITSLANIVSIGYFSEEDINEIDNSAGYEIIAVGSDNNEPIILTYQYGAGVCIVNTMIDGYHHNDPNSCQWGRTGEAIIHYMDEIFMRGSAFILEPTDGEIGPDRDMDVFLRLDGEFFREGETRLAVHFYSNDQENPDQIIEVTVASDGIPEIDGMPELFPLENAEVIEFDDFHTTNREYSVPFNVRNRGTSDLIINDVTVSDPDNYEIMGIENEMIILPQEEIEGQIIFHPVNAGELDCRITLSTNARNVENGELWWNITGDAVHSADIDVALPGGRESVVVFSTPDAEPVDRNWSISNLTPENGDDLEFRISIDDVEEVGNRDGNVRRVRQIENSIPCRDELGDILSEFQLPLEWYSGLTTDGEFLYLTESRGNEPGLLYVVSIAEERVVAEYEIQSWCFSIEFDGENLWIATFNSPEIRIYTRDGDQIGQFNAEQVSTYSMASDQTEFVYMKKINNPIYVYSIADREFVGTINHQPGFNNDAEVAYIMCAPSQADGSIWGFARNHGYRARINGNRLENVQQFNFNEMIIWSDVAHDGENIWYSNRGLATCMDDGIMDIRPDWLSVEPTDGVIEPGNQIDLTFTLNPAGCEEGEVLETTAVIATNDPLSPIVEIPVTLSLDPTPLRHFTADNPRTREVDGWVEDNAFHTITVTSVEFNGGPVPLDWEIGVITPEGALAGGAVWRDGVSAEFHAYGNSNEFDEITGFRVGEGFTFMVWDHVEDEEHPAEIEFIEGPEVWNRDGNTTVALGLFGNRNLILQLAQSWNMISLNVDPQEFYSENDDRGPQIITMFEQLRIDDENHRVELLKNEVGRFWTPNWGFINIPYWELTEGYQIKLSEDSEAEFSGSPIEFDTDIPLNPGWNISSYFPDYELDASAPDFYVLSPIIDFVELAKDDIGRFMTPEFIFSNMEPWRETKGYQVKIAGNEGVVLNYPPDLEDEVIAGVQDKVSDLQIPALRTSENMSLLINSFVGLVDDGDQIFAIGTSGRILGTGIVRKSRCGLAIWGNDLSTEGRNGASEGEAFTLKQKKSGSNIEESLTIRQLLEGDELRYQKDGFIVLDAAIESALPTEFYISKNYPNPFNSTTTLTYGIPERANVNINIYDISGRFVESLINTEVNPGHHKITWSPREAPTGIYIVRCVAGWKKESLKVALIR